ncbi:2462_t:CDS:2, partial [Paraglomus occultum]
RIERANKEYNKVEEKLERFEEGDKARRFDALQRGSLEAFKGERAELEGERKELKERRDRWEAQVQKLQNALASTYTESATSGSPLFRLLSRPDVLASSVTADDVFDCYLQEMPNDTYAKIYDYIRKDVTDILKSDSINESAKCFLRKINDNWKVSNSVEFICQNLISPRDSTSHVRGV